MDVARPSSSSSVGKGHRRVSSLVKEFEVGGTQLQHRASSTSLRSDDADAGVPLTFNVRPGDRSPSEQVSRLRVSSANMSRTESSSSGERVPPSGRSASEGASSGFIPGYHQAQENGSTDSDFGGLGPSMSDGESNDEDVGAAGEDGDVFLPLDYVGSGFALPSGLAPSSLKQTSVQASHERHSRRHSRLHSRNLSVFFPRPGHEVTGSLVGYNDPPQGTQPVLMPSAKLVRHAMPGVGNASQEDARVSTTDSSPPAVAGRRGHHHRHSLSHNFFSFLDTNPSSTPAVSPTTPLSALPKAVPQTMAHHHRSDSTSLPVNPAQSLRSRYSHIPLPLRVVVAFAFHTPASTQLKLVVAMATVMFGGALWILGQAGESLATTGLGYLVVFDGMGALSRIWVEGRAEGIDRVWDAAGASQHGQSGLRLPFGIRRQVTLAHFAQCVYLLFSAVYVCKEAIEHVLLLHGPGEDGGHEGAGMHGSAHGSMGHGEALAVSSASGGDMAGTDIPTRILGACFAFCLFSALGSGNHAGLAEAAGPSTFTPTLTSSSRNSKHTLGDALVAILANPFVLITLLFSGGIAAASMMLRSDQLAPLDKLLALLESAAMFYIAYPAAVATGTVLLQTAPPSHTGQMAALQRGVRQISEHPKVVFIEPPRIWQMTPQFHAAKPQLSGLAGRASSTSFDAQASVVVANVTIHVRVDASDGDILDVTRIAREKCAPALRWAAGLSRDLDQRKGSIDAGAGGELTVAVVRGFPRSSYSHSSACEHGSH